MKILMSGAGGLVGTALTEALGARGDTVVPLVRKPRAGDHVLWDPAGGQIIPAQLEGYDAVIHLAGENIAAGRWTESQKSKIRESRRLGTALLANTLRGLARPPAVFVSASAIGFYGDRGEETLTETSVPGEGFLADVAREWENACRPAAEKGIRVVNPRFGVILSGRGGALAAMKIPFYLGVGGVLGSGTQYMSWVALDDVVGAVQHILATPDLSGPVNVVAPSAVTNRAFTKTLGRVIHRPTVLPMPSLAVRLVFGEMGDALFLASTRVEPRRLLATNFVHKYPDLETTLRKELIQG